MDSLRIVAAGSSEQARANARGKLFEKVAAEVLRRHGYEIDQARANVLHAGMEIDIEGRARIAGVPVYSECKCYNSAVESEKLRDFYAKYMTQWFVNHKSEGLFVAIPGLNSAAMGFYREHCESNPQITVRLLQEPDVLRALLDANIAVRGETLNNQFGAQDGTPGDRMLICSDRGFFWLQYIIPLGSGIASRAALFDSQGHPIVDQETVDYVTDLIPEIGQFEIAAPRRTTSNRPQRPEQVVDEVVEIRGSSACFEYQFPASPQFFVGRQDLLQQIEEYATKVVDRTTSCRGVLFEANSGWGKSSLVLATIERLRTMGHYAVAFDTRSASSSQFVLKATEHVLDKFGDFDGRVLNRPSVSGFHGATEALLSVGKALETDGRLLFVFFDQFENVFHLLDVLTWIANLSLKVADAGTNVVLGFSWKTDLVGLTREFPYRWRDSIMASCEVVRLPQFTETETNALLDRLAEELRTPLRKDLRFLVSEFSHGYPWLLKKLCAHVKNQRQAGVAQAEMVRGLLNVEQLFLDDLQGLTAEQQGTLRRIARVAPVSAWDVGEEFTPELVQSLVDRRLVVKVGTKYDIYWDIFRDYLNTGRLPIEEVYLLRAQVGSILKALAILHKSGGTLEIRTFKREAGLSDGAFLNVARDLRLLQLVNIDHNTMELTLPAAAGEEQLLTNVRSHLHDRLQRNRCVHNVVTVLRQKQDLGMCDLVAIIKGEFPYISAVPRTWKTYARVLAMWLDIADLAVMDESKSRLARYEVGSQVRDRSLSFAARRSGVSVPVVHFAPVVQVAARLVSAAQGGQAVDWSGIGRSTIYKCLSVLDEMNLISRRARTISISRECYAFALDPSRRVDVARQAAFKWPVFQAFISVLAESPTRRLSHRELGEMVSRKCGANWKHSTAEINAKIMLDWARHLGLAPGIHAHSRRGKFRSAEPQGRLFDARDEPA